MKRSPAPKRKAPLKHKRSKPRRSERQRDLDYMAFVRGRPCIVGAQADIGGCEGRTEADHAGRRPLGRKCSDRDTIPLCSKHHRDRTDLRDFFAGWSATEMRAWLDAAIKHTRTAYETSSVLMGPCPF